MRSVCICQHCGTSYRPKQSGRITYCSRECSYAAASARRLARLRAAADERSARRLHSVRYCANCGFSFISVGRAYCSTTCERSAHRRRSRRAAAHCAKDACRQRGAPLAHRSGAGRRKVYCDARCARRWWHAHPHPRTAGEQRRQFESKRRRQLRARRIPTERFTDREIFERDGWVCGICHEPVVRLERVPSPLAPTLDHIVPLARGGRHMRENVQCAHFLCNSRKGASIDVAAISV